MHPLRSRLVLRCVASLLLVGVAATLAPTASARDARADAFALLNDGAAFDAALAASAQADAGQDPLDVFVQTYVAEAGGGVSADVVYRLLDGPTLGHVAPPARPVAFVPAPPLGPTPAPGAAVLPLRVVPALVGSDAAQAVPGPAVPATPVRTDPRQPRGP